ncbi:MAG TPA: potassium-transporting ATPase subunit KdpA [Myxococcota bacterium]|nr:potassium-transporting ATPase subunit KdpA [Myxococcota bacterium]
MTMIGWIQILVFAAVIFALTKPLGIYMYRVFEGERRPLERFFGPVERVLYRLCGVNEREEQTWVEYTIALLLFSVFGVLITYAIQRLQAVLPLNPQGLAAVGPELSFNTAVSFTTNTNWQSYGGESTMSYLTQMAGLTWHNFVSVGSGLGVALALARGLTRRVPADGPKTLGNFWVDLVRTTLYVLLPLAVITGLALAAGGVIQNLSPYLEVTTLEGVKQILALGPAAGQIAIKQLGTNGGGFFNVNSAHPFENATAITNFIECVAILMLPAAQTYTYGLMARSTKQGWALFAAMSIMFFMGIGVCYWAEARPNPIVASVGATQPIGNMEGKETRFGVASSTLWAVATTDASNGSVNSMHDSYTPLGGLVPLVNIELGEVVFGGVGAGLYGILVMVVLSVFIAGLMVGRTPEYLGKKIEAREMKLAMLYVLIFPLLILGFAAWAAIAPYGVSSLNNSGPHGLSEMLYAFSSAAGNNGSAFAGLNANTPWWNVAMGIVMLSGRFLMIVPALAIGGSMLGKKIVPAGLGTFPTHTPLFTGLLVGVVLIVGALTFFPALCLGPVVEEFLASAGKVY